MEEALQARIEVSIEASFRERLARQTSVSVKETAVLHCELGSEEKKRETVTQLLIRSASIGI
jgi:hypothetical protein